MSYNIHPLFVHFPIALLLLYSVIKVLPLERWFPRISWKDVERILLLFGFLGALAAIYTGDAAEQIAHPDRQLVDMHSLLATIATWIYGALFVGELSAMINRSALSLKQNWSWIIRITQLLQKILCNKVFSIILALIGLVCITLTGLLGGVMVYGVSSDPVAPFVLKLLGITL